MCVVTVERKWGKVRLEHAHSRLFPLNLCELDHLARQRGGGHPQTANTSAPLTHVASAEGRIQMKWSPLCKLVLNKPRQYANWHVPDA